MTKPKPKLTLEQYKEDAIARWQVHLYEWSELVKDIKWTYNKLKPYTLQALSYVKTTYGKIQLSSGRTNSQQETR